MRLESIDIMKAEDLPLKVRQEIGRFKGFVKIRNERGSPITTTVIPIDGTFSDEFRSVTKREGLLGKIKF